LEKSIGKEKTFAVRSSTRLAERGKINRRKERNYAGHNIARGKMAN